MTTREPITAPSHDALLADFFELNFRIEDLIAKHSLTPAQFLAFAKDPLVVETLDAFESLQQRHQRIAARQHQAGAAGHLHQSILDAPSTIETRRAATALARLTTQMQKPPSRKDANARGIADAADRDVDNLAGSSASAHPATRTALNADARSSAHSEPRYAARPLNAAWNVSRFPSLERTMSTFADLSFHDWTFPCPEPGHTDTPPAK